MEEEMNRELPREEINAENAEHPERQAKHEQLACATTEEDFNRQDSSVPPVEARDLAGGAYILVDCRTVGHVMVKIAMARNMIAGRVVVVDPESGRKLAAADQAGPVAHYVIIDEKDAVNDIDSMICALGLHAQQSDIETCFQLMKLIREADPYFPVFAPALDSILSDVRDPDWRTSVKTLMQVGIHGGPAFLAAVRAEDSEGMTFILSTQSAHVGEARNADLVEYTGVLNSPTALVEAAEAGSTHIVEKLLSAGANTERVDSRDITALTAAARKGREDVVSILQASGADVDRANSFGDTALIEAAREGRENMVVKLLASGANIEHANQYGNTALMEASWDGQAESVGELLTAGAKVECANSNGDTALTLAACGDSFRWDGLPTICRMNKTIQSGKTCHKNVVVKLLAARAKVEHANFDGYTALALAAGFGYACAVGELLAAGAKVDHVCWTTTEGFALMSPWHTCSDGDTALTLAADKGCNDIVIKLLAAGANINYANSDGDTALSLATSEGHADVIAQLLAAGAGIEQRN